MRKVAVYLSAAVIAISFSLSSFAQAADNTPVGYWQTTDEITGKPNSVVEIYPAGDDKLDGKVVKVFSAEAAKRICTNCSGRRHNQPMMNMVVLTGLKSAHDNYWKGGDILDPRNGVVYSCQIHVEDNGQKLDVHGFIGLAIFGRSQTWTRVDANNFGRILQ